jgi:hypothetical protein
MELLGWLLPTTERFPQKVRFTLARRIDDLALDVVEDLVEARYSKARGAILDRANLRLEKMRVLFRISHDRRFLSTRQYEQSVRQLWEVGCMLGGWRKAERVSDRAKT